MPEHSSKAFGQRLRETVPTAAVVVALVALAVWGHESNWTMPKFSALMGGKAEKEVDWCDEHNVPESICVECNPTLLPPDKDYGWCGVHGVMQCPLEHPDVAQLKTRPTITPAMLERASRAIALRPRAENNSRCKLHRSGFNLRRPRRSKRWASISRSWRRGRSSKRSSPTAKLCYDETRMAHLSSRVPGTVWRVQKQVGDRVDKGRCARAHRCGGSRPAEERISAGDFAVAAEARQRRTVAAAGGQRDSGAAVSGSANGGRRGAGFDCIARSRRW